ncbi:hypothetical protein BpHYR1_051618 [Brachionus plicatilis]|uniref:Uncharacterized protein n=1 Tax=Brachionus plicatilis TaxID=10195 RepID=A0A3M7QZC0_BRAPC|nr:hypothetical protein BpHYR1_051618 [Brachionus plicatilis]
MEKSHNKLVFEMNFHQNLKNSSRVVLINENEQKIQIRLQLNTEMRISHLLYLTSSKLRKFQKEEKNKLRSINKDNYVPFLNYKK